MIHRALVALDGSANADAAVTLALEWARRFGIELLGLGILDRPSITRPQPVPLGGGAYKHHRDETLLEDAHRRVLAFLGEFQRRCDAEGVPCTIVEDVGTPHEQILAEAPACDVVLLGRETHFHFETQDRPDDTLSQVLGLSPRPVVVVPRDPAPGEGVLVAYGSGREVARTLQTLTLLGLAGDEAVSCLPSTRTSPRPRPGRPRWVGSSRRTASGVPSGRWPPEKRRWAPSWRSSAACGRGCLSWAPTATTPCATSSSRPSRGPC
jgi:nucleotide-binding universal stress UspA family protein